MSTQYEQGTWLPLDENVDELLMRGIPQSGDKVLIIYEKSSFGAPSTHVQRVHSSIVDGSYADLTYNFSSLFMV